MTKEKRRRKENVISLGFRLRWERIPEKEKARRIDAWDVVREVRYDLNACDQLWSSQTLTRRRAAIHSHPHTPRRADPDS